jgi:hypothetical protein|tara:strand:+ start:591 stop:767 length:177 start_codon:yes stop_codon:yes gene_type:complete
MIEVDMGGAIVEELAGLKRVERTGDKISLIFEGMNGNEVFLTASAMHDGMVWNVREHI